MSTTALQLRPLTFVDEPDGVTVGCPDTDTYVVLPADGAALLRRLAYGASVPEAAEWYRATYGQPVDLDDFLAALHELGFVRPAGEVVATPATVPLQRLGRIAFAAPAWTVYAAVTVACLVVLTAQPQLRPRAEHVFFAPSLLLVQVLLLAVQIPATLWHEAFHVLAARRLGLPSRLGISRRLYFVVFETHLNGLLGVPRGKRYLPFLAGMLADVLLLCGLTLAASFDSSDGMSGAGRFALAVAYTVLIRLAWQCYIFLRTDLYYVLVTALGCTDLHGVTSAYLRERFGRLPGVRPAASDDAASWSTRDRRLAPWFALLTVGGVAFLLATAALLIAPVALEFGTRLATALAGGTIGGAAFWDSAAALTLIVLEFVVLPLWAGRRRRRATPSPDKTKGSSA